LGLFPIINNFVERLTIQLQQIPFSQTYTNASPIKVKAKTKCFIVKRWNWSWETHTHLWKFSVMAYFITIFWRSFDFCFF